MKKVTCPNCSNYGCSIASGGVKVATEYGYESVRHYKSYSSAVRTIFDWIQVSRKGLYGIVNSKGESILPCVYKSIFYDSLQTKAIGKEATCLIQTDSVGNVINKRIFTKSSKKQTTTTPTCC